MSEIDNSVDVDSAEEIEEKKVRARRKDGTFRKGVSGNPNGRRKGSTGKLNETRLVNIANKYGPYAAEQIIKIADAEMKKGNSNTALKGYITVFSEFAKMVNAQKSAELRAAGKKLVDDDEEDSNDIAPVVFSTAANS